MAKKSIPNAGEHYEDARSSLDGLEAVNRVLFEIACGGNKCDWSSQFLDHLREAQRILVAAAMGHLDEVAAAAWAHAAIAGNYGEEAKAMARAEYTEA